MKRVDREKLGEFIKKTRIEKEYKLREFAELIGKSPTTISLLENGKIEASEALILEIALKLDQSPDVMLAMCGKITEAFRDVLMQEPELVAEIIQKIQRNPKKVLKAVREVRDGEW